MMKSKWVVTFILSLFVMPLASAQGVKAIKFDELEKMLKRDDDTLRIVNFWATWCAPCVKELPYFEKLNSTYKTEKIRVILVSMDYFSDLESKLKPFVTKNKIRSKVVLLNEPELESWVDQLTPEWSGAVPMTLMLNNQKKIRHFTEKPLTETELNLLVNQYKQ
jgi:thiol-disulfide isomerase/thioredoxin